MREEAEDRAGPPRVAKWLQAPRSISDSVKKRLPTPFIDPANHMHPPQFLHTHDDSVLSDHLTLLVRADRLATKRTLLLGPKRTLSFWDYKGRLDGLLCSCNARSPKTLVGHAQWETI